jgi:hypothetical protein
MAAETESNNGSIEVHTPRTILRTGIEMVIFEPYDVTRNGKKFVVNTMNDSDDRLTLMVNWTARLKAR